MKKSVCFLVMTCTLFVAVAQDKNGFQQLPLDDMSAFRPQAGNWQIVGSVMMDPNVDIHQPAQTPPSDKKKKKSAPETKAQQAVTFQAGKGILLNLNDESKKDNLLTSFEHGDIELELEVMLPKGSNSGVYLQGRYEVQLLDSWGVKNPSFSDIGGIYRNWEKEPGKIYMGKAPLSNPAKAPGLWQTLKIAFRAPRFDESGKKIENAKFTSVELNGVKIHDHVEVPLPTGGPIENNEKAKGPIMIQGDHGPVAFRNFRYKLLEQAKVKASDITYKTYYGEFKNVPEFVATKPSASGAIPELSVDILESENAYGVTYTGNITVPQDNDYNFNLIYTGGIRFTVNNQQLLNFQRGDSWRNDNGKIRLKAGTYPFELNYFKTASWMPPRLALFVSSPNTYPEALHSFSSYPPDENPTAPIFIQAGSQPKLLRAFIDFNGDRRKRLTHTIGVGDPSGINYVYDLKAGNIVCVWRGAFVDATPMWHDRGDGSFKPLGAVQYLSMDQPLAVLGNQNEPFPSTGNETDFKGKGYKIDEKTSRPTFVYVYKGFEVNSSVYPEDDSRTIAHEISFNNKGNQANLFFKLAEGVNIEQLPNGTYAINDRQYYVKSGAGAKPFIREVNGKKELVTPVEGNSLKYSIIW